MNKGYIKLNRSIQEWYGNTDPYRFSLWVHLLLLANHSDKKWLFKGKPYKVKRGQFITSRISLAGQTGISQSRVERLLNEFEKQEQIEQQKTNRNRLISIFNYNTYQQVEQPTIQQADNKRTTSGQQKDTNNNVKNVKNVKKEPSLSLYPEVEKQPNPAKQTHAAGEDTTQVMREKKVYPQTFEQLWDVYPRKSRKADSYKEYKRTVKTREDEQRIKQAMHRYLLKREEQDDEEKKYTLGSVKWFRNWEGEM